MSLGWFYLRKSDGRKACLSPLPFWLPFASPRQPQMGVCHPVLALAPQLCPCEGSALGMPAEEGSTQPLPSQRVSGLSVPGVAFQIEAAVVS